MEFAAVKWLNMILNLRISDSWLGHQRQAMENIYIYIYSHERELLA